MYTIGERTHHRTHRTRVLLAVASLGVAAAVVWASLWVFTAPPRSINNSPPVTTRYAPDTAARTVVEKPLFTMKLPYGWQERRPEGGVQPPSYRFWAGSGKTAQLDMYIDNVPPAYALNKVLVVSPTGNGLTHGTVSENCSTFTDTAKTDPRTAQAPSKWQGVSFVCDVGNYTRAVVGTASAEGANVVSVEGSATGKHKLFVVYTDNAINPDYAVLYDILASLRFK